MVFINQLITGGHHPVTLYIYINAFKWTLMDIIYIVYKMRYNIVYDGFMILYTSDILLVC